MFAINITYGHNDSQKALLFKTSENADGAAMTLDGIGAKSQDMLEISDDFGQSFNLRKDSLTSWSYEDLDKTAEMQVEIAIHNQKVQARAQSAVMNDPQVRASMAMASMGRPGMGLQG